MGLLIWGVVMFILVFVGLLVAFLFYKSRPQDVPEDRPILHTYIGKYSKGYAEGVIVDVKEGSERTSLLFEPKDENFVKIYNEKKKDSLKPILLTVRKDLLIHYPKGTWSKNRSIFVALPQRAEDLPEAMKETLQGRMFMKLIEEKNTEWTQVKVLRDANDAKADILGLWKGKEISSDYLEHMQKVQKEALKNVISIKSDNNTGIYNPNPAGNRPRS